MAGLFLDYYEIEDLNPEVSSSSGVYAMVFDNEDNALELGVIGPGIYALFTFAALNQNSHAIPLERHSERTKFWSADIGIDQLDLPDTPDNEHYYKEYWSHPGTGSFNRSTDTLLRVDKFIWNSNVDITEVGKDEYIAHCSIAYDSSAGNIYFAVWLERNGSIVTDPTSCNVDWIDKDGATIQDISSSSPHASGVFFLNAGLADLDPDRAGFATVKVTDANGVDHESGASPVTWD